MSFRFAHLTSRSCADKCSLQGDATHEPFPGSALPRSRSDSYGKRDTQGKQPKSALICSALPKVGTGYRKKNKEGKFMNVAEIKYRDIANGLGVRVSLFVSGCRHGCVGCFNEIAWDFDFGTPYDKATEDRIIEELKPDYVEGLTLLGGEPFEPENRPALLGLLRRVRRELPGKNVWIYSGFTFEELIGEIPSRGSGEDTEEMLALTDVLVDGPFVFKLKDITLRFRGSSNQRIIDVPRTLESHSIVPWNSEANM